MLNVPTSFFTSHFSLLISHFHYICANMSKLLKLFLSIVGSLIAVQSCKQHETASKEYHWAVPDTADIPRNAQGDLIRYGRELIVHTSLYFGPDGSISKTENG